MATWNTDNPKVGNTIAGDIPDIEENFQELHDVITAITTGTLGTTAPASFEVDTLADGTTGFASATCQPFYNNAAPTGWTRYADLEENSMFCYAKAGNPGTGGAVDPQATHTHTVTPSPTASQCLGSGGYATATPTLVTSSASTAPYYIEMILAKVD